MMLTWFRDKGKKLCNLYEVGKPGNVAQLQLCNLYEVGKPGNVFKLQLCNLYEVGWFAIILFQLS